ncbi:MAG: P-II family nitrogen regulator [Planctomycetota bacterium]
MRLVIAYIRPEKLPEVKQALFKRDVLKISVSNALGCGDEPTIYEQYRGRTSEVDLHKKVRIEAAVNESFVQNVVDGIVEGAQTGEVGDGKIFVIPLEDCYRIRTGEQGHDAIG